MLEESMAMLLPAGESRRPVFVDATFGGGGHTEALLQRSRTCRVIALDADPAAVERARELEKLYPGRLDAVHANFGRLGDVLDERAVRQADGIVYDLGLSSMQLADEGRGFSFSGTEPLDMRLDSASDGATAAQILNTTPEPELADLIFQYGDERHARRIARQVVRRRERSPLRTTSDLVAAILSAQPRDAAHARRRMHPATRTFQALRIAVNDELGNLERSLDAAGKRVRAGGRIAVISFHSGEDRIVKSTFRAWHKAGRCELLTRKPLSPGTAELAENPRSRSAKLRGVSMIGDAQEAQST
jgi:16S rRNA (cytosine1402-N4)-methyltransferase